MSFLAGLAQAYREEDEHRKKMELLSGKASSKRKSLLAEKVIPAVQKRNAEIKEMYNRLSYLKGRGVDENTLNVLSQRPEELDEVYESLRKDYSKWDEATVRENVSAAGSVVSKEYKWSTALKDLIIDPSEFNLETDEGVSKLYAETKKVISGDGTIETSLSEKFDNSRRTMINEAKALRKQIASKILLSKGVQQGMIDNYDDEKGWAVADLEEKFGDLIDEELLRIEPDYAEVLDFVRYKPVDTSVSKDTPERKGLGSPTDDITVTPLPPSTVDLNETEDLGTVPDFLKDVQEELRRPLVPPRGRTKPMTKQDFYKNQPLPFQ